MQTEHRLHNTYAGKAVTEPEAIHVSILTSRVRARVRVSRRAFAQDSFVRSYENRYGREENSWTQMLLISNAIKPNGIILFLINIREWQMSCLISTRTKYQSWMTWLNCIWHSTRVKVNWELIMNHAVSFSFLFCWRVPHLTGWISLHIFIYTYICISPCIFNTE